MDRFHKILRLSAACAIGLTAASCEPPNVEERTMGPTTQDIAEASMLFRAMIGDDRRPQGLLLVRELKEGMEKKAIVELLGNPDATSTAERWIYPLDGGFSKIDLQFASDTITDVAWSVTEDRLQVGETATPPPAFPAPALPKDAKGAPKKPKP